MPSRDELPKDFPAELLRDEPFYRATGCRECRQVGYRGRMGIYELMQTTDNIRQLAHDRVSSWQIRQEATKEGMKTLRDDGWCKVSHGQTSIDEVIRVTKGDHGIR